MTLTLEKLLRLLRFGSGAALSFGSIMVITFVAREWANLSEQLAFAISLILVFFINFATLRWIIFRSTRVPVKKQMRGFLLATVGFRVIEYLAFLVLLSVLNLNYLVVVALVLVVSFAAKFEYFNRKIFRPDTESVI